MERSKEFPSMQIKKKVSLALTKLTGEQECQLMRIKLLVIPMEHVVFNTE